MPSEATLLALEDDFKRIARTNQGSPEVLSQYKFETMMGWDVGKGTCQGLSIMWLAYRHSPTMGTSLFKELLNDKLPAGARAALQSITEEANRQQSRGSEDDAIGLEREKKAMKFFGLNFVEQKLYGGGWGKGHSDLGKYICKNAGYYLFDIPGHAMAAHSGRGLPMFYDPNIGEATFISGDGMGSFFSQYFKSSVMMKAYGKGGAKLQVGITRYL